MEVKIWSVEDQNGRVSYYISKHRMLILGTHTGEFMGIPPTGKHVVVRFAFFDKVVDGKMVSGEILMDTASLLIQLGVMQPPTGF